MKLVLKMVGVVLLLLVGVVSNAAACQFVWNAVTTNTDGTAVTNLAGYRLYLNGVKFSVDIIAPAVTITVSGVCQAGSYTVTAFNAAGFESAPSSPFVVSVPSVPGSLMVRP
jgi:hypothetical protein